MKKNMKIAIASVLTFIITISLFYIGDIVQGEEPSLTSQADIERVCRTPSNNRLIVLCGIWKQNQPPKWEYMGIKAVGSKNEAMTGDRLQAEGLNGWEWFMQAKNREGDLVNWFKRPKR